MGKIAPMGFGIGTLASRLAGGLRRCVDLHKAVRSMRNLEKVVPEDEDGLCREYGESELAREPDAFVLYRIVGNDLWPRHEIGQSLANLDFILRHEPELEGCEKRWVVNRIMDPVDESAIIGLLQRHGRAYVRIPFVPEEFREVGFVDCPSPPGGFPDKALEDKETLRLRRSFEFARCRLKNNYVMNNNGARNAALRDGRGRAKWIIPADGNCFFTDAAWELLRKGVSARPHLKYFLVPMARVGDNAKLLRRRFRAWAIEEPQLVFRRDSLAEFDEEFSYGRRPKVELFWRLGVPGKWDRWKDGPWDLPRNPPHPESGQFGVTGWVARLSSGMNTLEVHNHVSFLERGNARQEAILGNLAFATAMVRASTSELSGMTCYSEGALEGARKDGLIEELLAEADLALGRGPYSVVEKSSLPPSGNPHDYWHPAPYWWPNPKTRNGLPYVWRDGERVPGTGMFDAQSNLYDRSRLQAMFDDTTVLALAWMATRKQEYAAFAARNVRAWFLAPETRMTPHLRFAQVRLGHNGNQGSHTGIIEFKDLHYFLDAVRIAERSGALAERERMAFQCWLWKYLCWLRSSPQGLRESRAENNHGVYYDLQVAAIANFLGDEGVLDETLDRAEKRLVEHFAPDGSQPHELKRTTTAHYCCFNLQGWIQLAEFFERRGRSLWRVDGGAPSLENGVSWLLDLACGDWPYEQTSDFDAERFQPILFAALHGGVAPRENWVRHIRLCGVKARFHPHDGIPPFWRMGNAAIIEKGKG